MKKSVILFFAILMALFFVSCDDNIEEPIVYIVILNYCDGVTENKIETVDNGDSITLETCYCDYPARWCR